MGLVVDGKVHVEVDHPYLPGIKGPDAKSLENIIQVMSFSRTAGLEAGRGLNDVGVALATRIFAEALEHVAPLSPHEQAIRSVADALRDSKQITISRRPNIISEDFVEQNFECRSRVGASDVARAVSRMRVGEHAFFPVNNSGVAGGHMVALSLSKIDAGAVRVSFVNTVNEKVGSFIDAPLENIERGLESFFAGDVFKHVCETYEPKSRRELAPTSPDASTIFTEWMKTLHPGADLRADYFDGKPLLQPPQKGGACTIEAVFALMATTLPRPAYKLAKAACLSTVLETGKAVQVVSPAQQRRIEERLNSAVRGATTEPRVERSQPSRGGRNLGVHG